MQNIDIEAMKNIAVQEVDRSAIVDYKDIKNTYPKTDITFTDVVKQIISGI